MDRCQFNSTESKDIEYIYSQYFNKEESFRFSSSAGKYVGFDEYGKQQAERFNEDPAVLEQRRNEKARYCEPNLPIFSRAVLSKSGESSSL